MGICQGCQAGCCRSFAVPITGADLLRLERTTGKNFWDFACRWADEQGTIAAHYAPHFHFQDEPETPFVICLKHEESRLFPQSPRCHFLYETPADAEHPLGTGSCGIYEGRPAACRVFPTRFDLNTELPIIHDVPEYGRAEKLPQFKLCPRQWTPADVDPLEVTQELAIARYEIRFFHRIAQLWNRHAGPWNAFPDFLREVYLNRLTVKQTEVLPATHNPAQTPDIQDWSGHIVKMPQASPAHDQQKRGAA